MVDAINIWFYDTTSELDNCNGNLLNDFGTESPPIENNEIMDKSPYIPFQKLRETEEDNLIIAHLNINFLQNKFEPLGKISTGKGSYSGNLRNKNRWILYIKPIHDWRVLGRVKAPHGSFRGYISDVIYLAIRVFVSHKGIYLD